MIKLESSEFKPPTFLDVSSLNAFRRCEARYAFRHLLHLANGEPTPALDYGSAVHCAMPFLQRGDLDGAISHFRASWESSGNEPDEKRNTLCAVEMLTRWHMERFVGKTIPYHIIEPPSGVLEPEERYSDQEFAFCVSLSSDALPFAGRTDAVARANIDQARWVVEYKTTSELSDRAIKAFVLNSQIVGYCVATSILTGERVTGAFLELLRVSKANPDNLCLPISVSESVMDSFIQLFCDTSRQITHCCESCCFQQDFSACTPYPAFGSHGYMCEYASLCQSPDWRTLLGAYVRSEWKPFKELSGTE